jgi:hypothetical protein
LTWRRNCDHPDWLSGLAAVLDLMEGRMRRFVVLAIAILVVLIGYAIKTTVSTSPTAASLMAVATPVATLSPHEIHLNYKGMKDLPVHDSTNAN